MDSALVIAPTRLARFGYAVFECVTAVGMIALAQPWLKPITAQSLSLAGLGVLLIVAGLEFPSRRVIISANVVRERRWFRWRTYDLPSRVIVGRDRGRVVVAEAPTGRIVVRFIREFGRPAAIEKQLFEFFEASGRLEPTV